MNKKRDEMNFHPFFLMNNNILYINPLFIFINRIIYKILLK